MITITKSPAGVIPSKNCGESLVCVEDNDVKQEDGTKSQVIVSLTTGYAVNDIFTIAGEEFKVVNSLTGCAGEVLFGADPETFANNLRDSVLSHPCLDCFNVSSVTVSPPNYTINLIAKGNGYKEGFENSDNGLAWLDIGGINGTDDIYKTCYVKLKVKNTDTGEFLCIGNNNETGKPYNITGPDKAEQCFDIQSLLQDDTGTQKVRPVKGGSVITYDARPTANYQVSVYSSCKVDVVGCERKKSPLIETSEFCVLEGWNDECESLTDYVNTKVICSHPADHRTCPKSHREVRILHKAPTPTELITVTGLYVIFDDQGNQLATDIQVSSSFPGGVYIFDVTPESLGYPEAAEIDLFIFVSDSSGATTYEPKTILFESGSSKKCCGCHKAFVFAGTRSNNETINATCDLIETISFETVTRCEDAECCSFDGGTVNDVKNMSKVNTSRVYACDKDFLCQFLSSSCVYLDENDGNMKRVSSVAAAYTISHGKLGYYVDFQYFLSNKNK